MNDATFKSSSKKSRAVRPTVGVFVGSSLEKLETEFDASCPFWARVAQAESIKLGNVFGSGYCLSVDGLGDFNGFSAKPVNCSTLGGMGDFGTEFGTWVALSSSADGAELLSTD